MNSFAQRARFAALAPALAALLAACGGGGGDGEPAAAAPAPQTLTFAALANRAFSATPVALVASASSGLAVSLASSTPAVCTVSSASVALVGLGTCTITASQAGNASFAAANPVVNSFLVTAGAQTITFVSPGNQTLGMPTAPLIANSSAGLPVAFTSSTSSVCTVNGTVLELLAAGTCTVVASQTGNANFAAAPQVPQSFVVAAQMAAQSISFTAPGNQVLGTTPPVLAATASSGLPVAFASTTPAVCLVNGAALNLLAAGTCTVAASQAGNASFAAATAVLNSFTVAPAAQTISFTAPPTQTLGSPAAALSATASSGLPVTLSSSTPTVCTVNGSALGLVAAGTCTLNASQPGNANVAAAVVVTRSFTVAPAAQSQTISFNLAATGTVGSTPLTLAATATSGLAVSLVSNTPAVCTVNGGALSLLAVGSCTVVASQAGNASFAAAAPVSRTLSVTAAPPSAQSLLFNSPGDQSLGTPPIALMAAASTSLPVTFASTTPTVCTVSGSTLTLVAVGNCTVVATQAGNATFAPVSVSRTIGVAAASQTLSFASPGNQLLGSTPAPLVATSSAGLPVSFSASPATVCTVSGTTLTLVAAGTCTVVATQAGNATFAPASLSRSFAVSTAGQTISFTSPGNQTLGTTPAPLVATSSAGLPVSFSASPAGVCTVNGSSLTLVAAGTCTVTASQAGNASIAPASVSVTFTVAAPVVAAVELMANGGFEAAATVAGQFAQGWRGVGLVPASWSTTARSGSRSAALAVPDPGLGGSGLAANSVEDGGLPSILGLYVGRSTTLRFWARGNASFTGNVNFSLRYLDATGNILNPVVNTQFQGQINATGWTQISLTGPAIPANTSAIFLEMTLAVGPTGVQPPGNCGVDPATGTPLPCDYGQARVFIDDISVLVNP